MSVARVAMLDIVVPHRDAQHTLEVGWLVHMDPLGGLVFSLAEDSDGVLQPHHHGVGHRGNRVRPIAHVHVLQKGDGCCEPHRDASYGAFKDTWPMPRVVCSTRALAA